MKHIARLWENMLARRALSMALCLALAVTSAGVCVASTNSLIQETRAAGEEAGGAETGWEAARADTQEPAKTLPEPVDLEGETLEESGGQEGEAQEDARCLHEFTGL